MKKFTFNTPHSTQSIELISVIENKDNGDGTFYIKGLSFDQKENVLFEVEIFKINEYGEMLVSCDNDTLFIVTELYRYE